jgi:hypothetical protein
METGNYLPYTIDKGFSQFYHRYVRRGSRNESSDGAKTKRWYKRYAHRRTRRKVKLELLAGKEISYKYGVDAWVVD